MLYQPPETLTRGPTHIVMPANAGIHDFSNSAQRKSWIPAFAGMTRVEGRCVNDWGGWYYRANSASIDGCQFNAFAIS